MLRRQQVHDARATPTEPKFNESCDHRYSRRRPSLVVKTEGDEYVDVEVTLCRVVIELANH